MSDPEPRVAVVGAGAWGTTLARLLARREPVTLVTHSAATAERIRTTRRNEPRLPGIDLPGTLRATDDPSAVTTAGDLVVFAVPSSHLRSEVARVGASIPASANLLSVTKGLEAGTLLRMSEVIADAGGFDPQRIAVLSGPNLALEIAHGGPASAVVAADDQALAQRVVQRLGSKRFRLYVNQDVLGVELCGALKNVLAIAAGACDGLGLGTNARAALLTRGISEMARLAVALGGDARTVMGLSGVGDLILTATGALSRNRALGEKIAAGVEPAAFLASQRTVAEGYLTSKAAFALARKHGVEVPITEQVYHVLHEGRPLLEAMKQLVTRSQKDELWGF